MTAEAISSGVPIRRKGNVLAKASAAPAVSYPVWTAPVETAFTVIP